MLKNIMLLAYCSQKRTTLLTCIHTLARSGLPVFCYKIYLFYVLCEQVFIVRVHLLVYEFYDVENCSCYYKFFVIVQWCILCWWFINNVGNYFFSFWSIKHKLELETIVLKNITLFTNGNLNVIHCIYLRSLVSFFDSLAVC